MKARLKKPQQTNMPRIRRLPIRLERDTGRVVTLPFDVSAQTRVAAVFDRVDYLSENEIRERLEQVLRDFQGRHRNLEALFEEHYSMAARLARRNPDPLQEKRLLLGAYFTMEYSIEGAALFNPSIVPHPDQRGVSEGALRFILSLRAVGEGHVSSTVFQAGMVFKNGDVVLDPEGDFSARTRIKPDYQYHREIYRKKLREMGITNRVATTVLDALPDRFTLDGLERAIERMRTKESIAPEQESTLLDMQWLARANYVLELGSGDSISDLILFPRDSSESRGIEDLRLVRFIDDDGTITYYGTFTGFNGQRMLPMLLETKDFRTISIHTLNGACVQNKGMALFPRRIHGHYAMCSRIDGRNLYLMYSDMVHFWETAKLLAEPRHSWELRLIGNCGSPLETPEGWLLITHGVGPMRRYCIGAMLLDLDDPFKVRGRLREPLLEPTEEDREGYVPNVVYSCGALLHNGRILLPYAISDCATRMASLPLNDLIGKILHDGV